MCAQRGVCADPEMENVRETRREREGKGMEKRHRERNEKVGVEVHARGEEEERIEGERRNTWFYLQKQSLRGTNTGRH